MAASPRSASMERRANASSAISPTRAPPSNSATSSSFQRSSFRCASRARAAPSWPRWSGGATISSASPSGPRAPPSRSPTSENGCAKARSRSASSSAVSTTCSATARGLPPPEARQLKPKNVNPKKKAGCRAGLFVSLVSADQTLTSGPLEAGPLEPPPPLEPPDFGFRGVVRLRVPGSFSGFGVTGPSTNSKPILFLPSALASSGTSTTRTWPPPLR